MSLLTNSNTTLVKVKCCTYYPLHQENQIQIQLLLKLNAISLAWFLSGANSNTTLVKVKFFVSQFLRAVYCIQIQLLLKLNARKINLYDFIVLLKVLINKDFTYFLPAIMRFEGI